MFNIVIEPEIVEKEFKKFFDKDWELDIWHSYQYVYNRTKIDIIFTKDSKAMWIMKYKGQYYGDVMENIKEKDGLVYIDIYTTFVDQAIRTIKDLKK
jgi:hypothetical protein